MTATEVTVESIELAAKETLTNAGQSVDRVVWVNDEAILFVTESGEPKTAWKHRTERRVHRMGQKPFDVVEYNLHVEAGFPAEEG